jgi:inner membrane protein
MSAESTPKVRIDRNSPLLRIMLIGLLILLLQIPILKISGVIQERSSTRAQAMAEVASKWGNRQAIVGPYLVVPYKRRWVQTDAQGRKTKGESVVEARFLPADLVIGGEIHSETRHRGIFDVPVYRADLKLSGQFRKPDFSGWEVATPADILWDRARMVIEICDARAITGAVALRWGKETISFVPGTGSLYGDQPPALHADLKSLRADALPDFSIPLSLNGTEGISFVPYAERTNVTLRSDWPNPSFQGNWLPQEQSVTGQGFTASWSVSWLGRNYPQRMQYPKDYAQQIEASKFGVNFLSPVDGYRVADRLVKYELLFLSLTFVTLWLFELLAKLRVHPIQYLLVGSAMCLFYLLELSLSEQLGLAMAYSIASSAVTLLVGAYCLSVLKSAARASVIAAVLALLYGYFYVLLQVQDYALLVGSVGLFVTLAAVMYATRRIDWYGNDRGSPAVQIAEMGQAESG